MWQEEKLLPIVQWNTRHLIKKTSNGNIKQASCTGSASGTLTLVTAQNLCTCC